MLAEGGMPWGTGVVDSQGSALLTLPLLTRVPSCQ
jgi:hypothetical protein